jgi:hypothetical protein
MSLKEKKFNMLDFSDNPFNVMGKTLLDGDNLDRKSNMSRAQIMGKSLTMTTQEVLKNPGNFLTWTDVITYRYQLIQNMSLSLGAFGFVKAGDVFSSNKGHVPVSGEVESREDE